QRRTARITAPIAGVAPERWLLRYISSRSYGKCSRELHIDTSLLTIHLTSSLRFCWLLVPSVPTNLQTASVPNVIPGRRVRHVKVMFDDAGVEERLDIRCQLADGLQSIRNRRKPTNGLQLLDNRRQPADGLQLIDGLRERVEVLEVLAHCGNIILHQVVRF